MCPRLREVHIDEDVATAAQAMQKLNIMKNIHIHPDNTVGLCKSSIVYSVYKSSPNPKLHAEKPDWGCIYHVVTIT
jgi:hypothetical protein